MANDPFVLPDPSLALVQTEFPGGNDLWASIQGSAAKINGRDSVANAHHAMTTEPYTVATDTAKLVKDIASTGASDTRPVDGFWTRFGVGTLALVAIGIGLVALAGPGSIVKAVK